MKIKWLGHSCFLITLKDGTSILTDPVDLESGYNISGTKADIVTVSHDHHDHNNISAVIGGAPKIINAEGVHEVNGIKITGIPTWHDDDCGTKRGKNLIFLIEADGLSMLHTGDLGQLLDPLTLKAVGNIDMLFVPVGGIYTIDSSKALVLMNILNPALTIPMHYKTEVLTFELSEIEPFLEIAAGKYKIQRIDNCEFEINTPIGFKNTVIVPTHAC